MAFSSNDDVSVHYVKGERCSGESKCLDQIDFICF